MAAYADFTYYSTTYLGVAIASTDFARLSLRASEIIDRLTFDRAASETDVDIIDKIKKANCAVAELYQTSEQEGWSDGIASEGIGSNSVSYVVGASKNLTAMEKFSNAAQVFLGSTGLMFRGFKSGEM